MSLLLRTIRILSSKPAFNRVKLTKVQYSSYESSPFLADVGLVKVKYQVTNSPEDWKYVERALPPVIVPEPKLKEEYPSGWKPASADLKDRPYYVARTKNYMIPVYLRVSQRGMKRHTVIKRIQGDIWLLEKEVVEFLQPMSKTPLRIQVNEFAGYICINGDYVNALKHWLTEKGY